MSYITVAAFKRGVKIIQIPAFYSNHQCGGQCGGSPQLEITQLHKPINSE